MKNPRASITACTAIIVVATLISCSGKDPRSKQTTFRLPQGFVKAKPGKFAIVAEAPPAGSTTPDARGYLTEPAAVLPAPDGGIVVVSQRTPLIFTWITKLGYLRPYITNAPPTYSDDSSPGGAISAYQDSPSSVVIVTDHGEIARIIGNHATRLAQLPIKGNGAILAAVSGSLLIQQENTTYQVKLDARASVANPIKIKGVDKGYAVKAISRDASTYFTTDGNSIREVDKSGKRRWTATIEKDRSITSITPDGTGGAWIGDAKGGLFHAGKDGVVTQVTSAGTAARSCMSGEHTPPISEVYSMLLRADQIYITDKHCDRVTAFGL
jgi:hypothetical protein